MIINKKLLMKVNQLGLTGYELEVYRSLLAIGLSSAKDLSHHCSVPLTAIYPNLNLLETKGLVKKYEGDLTKFQAIKPSLALENLAKNTIEEMKVATTALIQELESLPSSQVAPHTPVELSLGTQASMNLWYEMSKHAKKSIYVAGWRFGTKRSIYSLIHSLREIKKTGVEIRIIVIAINERTTLLAQECKLMSIPVKYLNMNNFSLIVIDEGECKLTLKNMSLKERVNLRIDDVDLVKGMKDYFMSLWSRAKNL